MIPWRGHNLIGTTDQPFIGNPDEYRVTRESIQGLIEDVNTTLGSEILSYDDVLYTYGGLRPLVEDDSADTYGASRRYEIHDNTIDGLQGLITVEGGKFTTSRNLAEKAIDLAEKKLGRRHTCVAHGKALSLGLSDHGHEDLHARYQAQEQGFWNLHD